MQKLKRMPNVQAVDIKLDMKQDQEECFGEWEEMEWNQRKLSTKGKKRLEGANTCSPDEDDDISLDYMNIAEEKRLVLIALCTWKKNNYRGYERNLWDNALSHPTWNDKRWKEARAVEPPTSEPSMLNESESYQTDQVWSFH